MAEPGDPKCQFEGDAVFYGFRWRKWLDDEAIAIASSAWDFSGDAGPLVIDGESIDGQETRARISGPAGSYTVLNTITTDEAPAQTKTFTFPLTIEAEP